MVCAVAVICCELQEKKSNNIKVHAWHALAHAHALTLTYAWHALYTHLRTYIRMYMHTYIHKHYQEAEKVIEDKVYVALQGRASVGMHGVKDLLAFVKVIFKKDFGCMYVCMCVCCLCVYVKDLLAFVKVIF